MTTEIKLPDLGEGTADVTIVRWLVHEGDAVTAGATLVEVATDKVDTEVAAPVSGTPDQAQLCRRRNCGRVGCAGRHRRAAGEAAEEAAASIAPPATSFPQVWPPPPNPAGRAPMMASKPPPWPGTSQDARRDPGRHHRHGQRRSDHQR